MRITKRDRIVLAALDKFRVLDIETAAALCGFTRYNKCADRLAILYQNGYINYYQRGVVAKRYYFIKQKGMNVIFPGEERISKKGKKYIHYKNPPTFRVNNVNHEVTTARVLAFILKCNPELMIDDFKTDRDMQVFDPQKRKMFKHFSDLLCEKYRIKVEVELSIKDKNRLRKNISFNSKSYVQIWIAGSNRIYERLLEEKRRYLQFDIHVVKLEALEKEPIILSKLYEEFLKKNPEVLSKKEEIERLKKEKMNNQ